MNTGIHIESRDLSFSYKRPLVSALEEITFSVERGTFSAVMGPNGSGKTTLLRLMLGLLEPDRGEIKVMGLRPWENPAAVQRNLGYVPQSEQVNERLPLRVAEVVLQGLLARVGRTLSRKGIAERLDAVLDMVDLADLAARPFGALSAGEQQRTLIARALILDPSVLVLDEPFASVDVANQQMIVELLRELATEHGVTILAVVHNVNILCHYLDGILLLNRRLVAFGSTDEVLQPELLREAYGAHVPVVVCEEGHRHPLLEAPHGRDG